MGVIENMKEVADLVKKVGDIDLNRKIVNLEGEVLDLTREKRRLEDRVETLERTLNLKEKLTFKEPFYYLEGDKTPYCPGCWEDKHSAVHVKHVGDYTSSTMWQCTVCKHNYDVDRNRRIDG
jgi:DNA repair exonuclease SbcCD ATPase subunit